MALQLRRGTNKERLQITPAQGELIFVTDWQLVQITGTTIDGSTETITFSAAHGLSAGDQVLFQSSTQLGLTQGTAYYVIAAGLTTTACRLATSSGGSAIDLTTGSALTLTFAKTPTNASGTPIGTNVTALWIGDGSTAGGIAGNTQGLDDLTDVEITTPVEGQTFYYDATTGLWKNTSIVKLDDVNNRVGVNNASPNFALDVVGDGYFSGDVTVAGNDIKSSSATAITLSGTNVSVAGDLTVTGNDIKSSSATAITLSGTNVSVAGDLTVTGNDIKSSSATAITLSGSDVTVAGDLTVTGNDIKSSSATAITLSGADVFTSGNLKVGGDIIRNSTGNDMITFATGSNALTTLSGDIQVNGNDIKASDGTTAITLSGANVTIAGDLTVNGTTTTVNSTTLTVDDKNIELASTASPSDTTADGGGITLKGTSDKKIFWQNSDDRWYIDNGDGNNYLIPVNLTDLNDVVITTATQGDFLWYNGTNWINDNAVIATVADQRPRFIYQNAAAGPNSAIFLRKDYGATGYSEANDDGVGINFSLIQNSDAGTPRQMAAMNLEYSATGDHQWYVSTTADNFATSGSVVISATKAQAGIYAPNFVLNRAQSGAPSLDATITANRGSSTDATIKWNETSDRWEMTNDFYTPQATIGNIDIDRTNGTITTNTGNLTLDSTGGTVNINDNLAVDTDVLYVDIANNRVGVNTNTPTVALEVGGSIYGNTVVAVNGDLGTNGENIYFNMDDGGTGATSSLVVKRGTNADVALRWNETDDRWETTVDGTTYIQLPNQDLDTDASPTFAGVTGGNIRVGVTGDNEIDTSSGGLTLDSSSGTVTVDDILAVNGNLNVDAGVLFVDVSNNYVGVNDATPSYPLDVTGDTNVVGTIYATGLDVDNVRIGLAATNGTNTIDTSVGNLMLAAATGAQVDVFNDFNVGPSGNGVLKVDLTNNRVGVNDTTPSYDLDVTGDIRATATVYAANLVLDSGSAAASTFDTHTTSNLASAATGTIASTTRRALKAVIKITEDTTGDCHMVEALLMRKGTTDTYITTYGEIYSTAALATFAADYDSGSGTLRLRATSTATNTIDINVVRVSID